MRELYRYALLGMSVVVLVTLGWIRSVGAQELEPPVGLVQDCGPPVGRDNPCRADFSSFVTFDIVLGGAKAGAWGNNNYTVATSRNNGSARASSYNFAEVRRRPGQPILGPPEITITVQANVQRAGRGFAQWTFQGGDTGVFRPLPEIGLADLNGVVSDYTDGDAITVIASGGFNCACPVTIGGRLFGDSTNDSISIYEEFSRVLSDESITRRVLGASQSFVKQFTIRPDEDRFGRRRVAVRTTSEVINGGFATVDPEFSIPPDRPDLELVLDAPPNPHPPGLLLTPELAAELAARGFDLRPLAEMGIVVGGGQPRDTTPPTTTATASPTPNGNGWNRSNVTLALQAQDEPGGSGVKEVHFALTGAQGGGGIVRNAGTSVSIAAEGTTTLTYFAVDDAGNQEAPRTLTVKIDKTPPTVTFGAPSPTPNAAGWNNTDVSVPFSASDSLSGVDAVSAASPLVLTTEGVAVRGAVTVTDRAGNSATVTSPAVKIDKTSPTVACSVSPNILWPPNHKLVDVTASVTVTDALSGPAGFVLISAANTEPTGSDAIQGFVVGTPAISGQLQAERLGSGSGRVYTLTYKGTDKAGNSTTCNTTVTVPHDQGQ